MRDAGSADPRNFFWTFDMNRVKPENRQDDDRFLQSIPNTDEGRGWSNRTRHSAKDVIQAQRMARMLGWFSIGLGVIELLAPRSVARLAGLDSRAGTLRWSGLREIALGVGILNSPKPIGWLWSRVLGDVIDLTALGKGAASSNASWGRVAATSVVLAGVTALDVKTSQALMQVADRIEDHDAAIHITKTIVINRSPEEIYRFWRNYGNLPQVMRHLESVEQASDKRSHWTARGPAGRRIQWDAETTEDRPNESIAWRSIPGSGIENFGSVEFQPATGNRGTLVRVELSYRPPAGAIGATIAKLLGEEPQLQLKDDLHRLKQMLEAGEIITTDGQPAGRARTASWKYDHAARRLAEAF